MNTTNLLARPQQVTGKISSCEYVDVDDEFGEVFKTKSRDVLPLVLREQVRFFFGFLEPTLLSTTCRSRGE